MTTPSPILSQFLQDNLAALANKVVHTQLVAKLTAHTPVSPSPFTLLETHEGDFSLAVHGQPIHSLRGAAAEAHHIVSEELKPKRYAQNLLIGLGLGYLLKALIDAKTAQDLACKVVIYEQDIELLHFVLSNVALHQWLAHPDVTLFHLPTGLFQQINGQYVKGDGMGILFTPGYFAAYQAPFQDIVTRLERNVDNANRNTELLQLRAKPWAQHFLQNTPLLPQAKPVDHLKGQFAGKTVVLVSAGPSLADSIETLRRLQDHVVIMAVGGAMRTLHQAGIAPHFVMYMDFMGPSKHLHGLDEPNRNSHVLTGPSAERYALDLQRKSLWVASLHFNEQFSWSLDEMFGHPLMRYHTGGTVSLLAFHIAVDMGFDQFILLGQDLALRNNQLYADGTQVTVGDDDVMRMPETDHSPAKHIKVKRVPGWTEGETVVSPEDYAHFLMHFENLVPLIRDMRPEARLVNASKGGAFIKGYEHVPLETLANELLKAPPVQVDEVMAQLEQDLADQYDPTVLAQRMHDHLTKLSQDSHHALALTRQAQPLLKTLMSLPFDQWYQPSQAYSSVFNELADLMETNPFFKHTFFHEQLTLHQKHNESASSHSAHLANFSLDQQYLKSIATSLADKVLPWLGQALAELATVYHIEPVTSQREGFTIEGVVFESKTRLQDPSC
jgi:hypothetical protein